MIKTPNYCLCAEAMFFNDKTNGVLILPPGTFVRPIELVYVPKHVLDSQFNTGFNKDRDVFCYTWYGIIPIPKKSIREA